VRTPRVTQSKLSFHLKTLRKPVLVSTGRTLDLLQSQLASICRPRAISSRVPPPAAMLDPANRLCSFTGFAPQHISPAASPDVLCPHPSRHESLSGTSGPLVNRSQSADCDPSRRATPQLFSTKSILRSEYGVNTLVGRADVSVQRPAPPRRLQPTWSSPLLRLNLKVTVPLTEEVVSRVKAATKALLLKSCPH